MLDDSVADEDVAAADAVAGGGAIIVTSWNEL